MGCEVDHTGDCRVQKQIYMSLEHVGFYKLMVNISECLHVWIAK